MKLLFIVSLMCFFSSYVVSDQYQKSLFCFVKAKDYSQVSSNYEFNPQKHMTGFCTHYVYGPMKTEDKKLTHAYPWSDPDVLEWIKTGGPEHHDPYYGKPVLVSVGGPTRAEEFRCLIRSRPGRTTFANSAVKYLRENGLAGLESHFISSHVTDIPFYTKFVKAVSKAFKNETVPENQKPLIHSIYVHEVWSVQVDKLYPYVDYIVVGNGLPSNPISIKLGYPQGPNQMAEMLHSFKRKGVPKENLYKLLWEFNFGYNVYTLDNPKEFKPNTSARTRGPAPPGWQTKSFDHWAYYEVCMKITNYDEKVNWGEDWKETWGDYIGKEVKRRGWHATWDEGLCGPYAWGMSSTDTDDVEWVAYDNKRSLALKANVIKARGYGGGYLYSLDLADFQHFCWSSASVDYPLLTELYKHLVECVGWTSEKPDCSPTADHGQCYTYNDIDFTNHQMANGTASSLRAPQSVLAVLSLLSAGVATGAV